MFPRPAIRLRCIADWAPEVLDEFEDDLDQFAALLPFRVRSFEFGGSAARQDWQFHSDLDVNLETGTEEAWRAAKLAWRRNPEQVREALHFLRRLMDKWGLRIDVALEHPSLKSVSEKTCYDLRERKHYRPEKTQRVVISEGRTFPRLTHPHHRPTVSFGYLDEMTGEWRANEDPYPPEEVERWAKRYSEKFLRIGDTADTAYLKR